ncbi:hypothetical protein GCM10027341_33060 [Spirosoma knui]
MILFATFVDLMGEVRPYSIANTKLEIGFEAINDIVKKGHRLLEAKILSDDRSWTQLPIEAFDGEDCQRAICEMMLECQLILGQQFTPGLQIGAAGIDLLNFHRICVFRLELAIPFFKRELSQIQHSSLSEVTKISRANQLTATLNQCQLALASRRSHVQDLF